MDKTAGNTNDKIDRILFHEYLWNNRDRNDYIPWTQKELADKFGITIFTLARICSELKDLGRLRKVRGKYRVLDPSISAWSEKPSSLF